MPQVSSTQPDLIKLVSGRITPDVIRSVSAQLGEDRGRTASALATSVPSVLTALSEVASTDTGAAHLKEVIDEKRRRPGEATGETAGLFSSLTGRAAEGGSTLIDGELGARATTLSDAVASTSGIRRDSAHKLMGGVSAIAVAAIAKSAGGMGSGALKSMFHDQRGEWVKQLPQPVASLFNGHSETTVTRRQVHQEHVAGPAVRRLEGPARGWLIPLVLVALGLIAIGLLRGLWRAPAVPQPPRVTQTAPALAPQANRPSTPAPAPAVAPAPAPVQPPAAAAPGNSEDLAAFLAGEGQTPQRFMPRPIGFAFGSTTLTPESNATLDQVGETLKAHPSAKIRVESFTDSVGSPESNLKLSAARSDTVKNELVDRGAAAENIETVGRGQDEPVAPNDTAEGRAENRRTEIVVTGR
jgi:OOP family OmpA-OmpF porin